MLTTVELFAGIGGFRLAADKYKIKTVWANDIDPLAAKVYRSNFGTGAFVEGNIYDFLDSIPEHDILTGGFPCQPFSKAGKKQGIGDYRGTLFEVIIEIVKKKAPKCFILENVNSLLYLDNGNHFRTILSALSDLKYKIEWKVFNAASFGLPQHRERVIIVGTKVLEPNQSYFLSDSDISLFSAKQVAQIANCAAWGEIETSKGKFQNWGMAYCGKYLSLDLPFCHYETPKRLRDVLQKRADPSFDFTSDTLSRIQKSQYVNRYYNGVQILYNQSGGARMGYSIFGTEGLAPTLTASTSRHYERYQVGERYRRLTNVEYARIQGFPDEHCKAVSVYQQYKLYGNAVPPQMIDYVLNKLITNNFLCINRAN